MDEDAKAFAITASLESRPVRKKKLPLKLIDSSYALSDVFDEDQLASKHVSFVLLAAWHMVALNEGFNLAIPRAIQTCFCTVWSI